MQSRNDCQMVEGDVQYFDFRVAAEGIRGDVLKSTVCDFEEAEIG